MGDITVLSSLSHDSVVAGSSGSESCGDRESDDSNGLNEIVEEIKRGNLDVERLTNLTRQFREKMDSWMHNNGADTEPEFRKNTEE